MSDTQFQIERLREEAELLGDCETSRLVDDAADEIERLGRENAELDAMLTGIFARRVQIEDALMKMAEGKLPLPDADKCRELALRLGTPKAAYMASTENAGFNRWRVTPREVE